MDDQHDVALRDRVRFGDPFANLARRKQAVASEAAAPLTERYNPDKLTESGAWFHTGAREGGGVAPADG
jgi:pre-mRNA-splicing factor CWC26